MHQTWSNFCYSSGGYEAALCTTSASNAYPRQQYPPAPSRRNKWFTPLLRCQPLDLLCVHKLRPVPPNLHVLVYGKGGKPVCGCSALHINEVGQRRGKLPQKVSPTHAHTGKLFLGDKTYAPPVGSALRQGRNPPTRRLRAPLRCMKGKT